MKFNTVGVKENPVIIMCNGSFTTGESLISFAEKLSDSYYVILPTYDGHTDDGTVFTTRIEQVRKIFQYLQSEGIQEVELVQGLSMGAEVALDLAAMMYSSGNITLKHGMFDGGPFFHFNPLMRKIMQKKFLNLLNGLKGLNEEEAFEKVTKNPMIKWMMKGQDLSAYKGMIGGMSWISPCLTDESIRNESDACYTFDFPEVDEEEQKKYLFMWSDNEPAHSSEKSIRKHYPHAQYRSNGNLGHGGFFIKQPEEYEKLIREVTAQPKVE